MWNPNPGSSSSRGDREDPYGPASSFFGEGGGDGGNRGLETPNPAPPSGDYFFGFAGPAATPPNFPVANVDLTGYPANLSPPIHFPFVTREGVAAATGGNPSNIGAAVDILADLRGGGAVGARDDGGASVGGAGGGGDEIPWGGFQTPDSSVFRSRISRGGEPGSRSSLTSVTSGGGASGGGGGIPWGGFQTPDSSLFRSRNLRGSEPPGSRSSVTSTSTTSSVPSTPSSRRGGLIEPLDKRTIVALVEGVGQARGEVGIACMNLDTPTLVVSQFCDTQSYTRVIAKLNIFRPHEILMTARSCDQNSPSRLYSQLLKEISEVKIIPIQRSIFNEGQGWQKVSSLTADEYASAARAIMYKYYGLSAVNALLKYLEVAQEHSLIFAAKTLRIEFQGCDQSCMIDRVTSQHLELLQNNLSDRATRSHSLLGILNSCKTPIGMRLLRMSILQPSVDINLINSRLDSVEELMKNREMLYALQNVLSKLPIDIDHLIAFLAQIPKSDLGKITESRLNNIIALKHLLEVIPRLAEVVQNSEDPYFKKVKGDLELPKYEAMLQTIKRIVHEEAEFQKGGINMKYQRCFAVKADVNPILDIARKAYCDLVKEINDYVVRVSAEMSINFQLRSSIQRGYYLQFTEYNDRFNPPAMPAAFLQVKKNGNSVTCTTETLVTMDYRANEILKEIQNLSGIAISELIVAIRKKIGILYKVSEAVANLDMIYSLAQYALSTPECVRPTFASDTTSIRNGRHPILDSISADPSVPNSTFLSDFSNFMVITGPNMSGKTTYIKQVACLQVVAQLGSFVPADAATFRISSNIMSRMSMGDNLEENCSSFGVEMSEMDYILRNADHTSLVIIDELGRATSVEEGGAFSWAICEKLLTTKRAFVLCATHHMIMTKLEDLYMNVLNYELETVEWKKGENAGGGDQAEGAVGGAPVGVGPETRSLGKLQYTHVLKRGITNVEFYGLKLAMRMSYPPHIVEKAIKMAKELMAKRGLEPQPQTATSGDTYKRDRDRALYLLGLHVGQLANSMDLDNLTEEQNQNLGTYMTNLQQEFLSIYPELGPGAENSEDSEAGPSTSFDQNSTF